MKPAPECIECGRRHKRAGEDFCDGLCARDFARSVDREKRREAIDNLHREPSGSEYL
jgi:hypothetical protein